MRSIQYGVAINLKSKVKTSLTNEKIYKGTQVLA